MVADLTMTVESVIIIVDDVKKLISIIMIIMLIIQYFPVREIYFFFLRKHNKSAPCTNSVNQTEYLKSKCGTRGC